MDEYAVIAKAGKNRAPNYIHPLADKIYPGSVVRSQKYGVAVFQLPVAMDRKAMQNHLCSLAMPSSVKSISPVFYAATKPDDQARMLLTGQIIVRQPAQTPSQWIIEMEKTFNLERHRPPDSCKPDELTVHLGGQS